MGWSGGGGTIGPVGRAVPGLTTDVLGKPVGLRRSLEPEWSATAVSYASARLTHSAMDKRFAFAHTAHRLDDGDNFFSLFRSGACRFVHGGTLTGVFGLRNIAPMARKA